MSVDMARLAAVNGTTVLALLAEGRDAAAKRVGDDEATHLVLTRPRAIIDNVAPGQLAPVAFRRRDMEAPKGWRRAWDRVRRVGGGR